MPQVKPSGKVLASSKRFAAAEISNSVTARKLIAVCVKVLTGTSDTRHKPVKTQKKSRQILCDYQEEATAGAKWLMGSADKG
ncbi:MAG: hypothetical protein C4297_10450 [Gemmataceae bacterium]